jgi:hypothetical protein
MDSRPTEFLPLLSRGKHRRPRNGACVMEYTSYLAGERWTDHPRCTHPLLGELARQVNDFISDDARQALGMLVPDMIGLTSTDLRIDLQIAERAAMSALPIVAEERQRTMAVAILTCERLAAALDKPPVSALRPAAEQALALAPAATRWAHSYTRDVSISPKAFRRRMAPAVVRYSVQGIARACVPDPDAVLQDLLAAAIEDCKLLCGSRKPITASREPIAAPPPAVPV